VVRILKEHYTNVTTNTEEKTITISFDGTMAVYNWTTKTVESDEQQFTSQVEEIVKHITSAVLPVKKSTALSAK